MAKTAYNMAALIAAISLSHTATADDLTKEITVEKDIVLQEREAQKLSLLPQFNLPAIETKNLKWTYRGIDAPVTHDITLLPPAAYEATMEKSPYRGYLDAGYFPLLEIGVSAGYRIVDKEATRLGAWLQYDGSSYKRNNRAGDKIDMRDHTATIGMNLSHNIDGAGTLDARLSYRLASFNFPIIPGDGVSQASNTILAGIGWHGTAGNFSYNAAVNYGFFNFTEGHDRGVGSPSLKPLTENHAKINLGGAYGFDNRNFVGADINTAFAGASNTITTAAGGSTFVIEPRGNYSHGYVAVTPYYRHAGTSYSIKLGIQLYDTWGGDNGFRIAPDLRADWRSGDKFAIYARFTGGNPSLNDLSSLFTANHYINPSLAYGDSHTRWNVDAGFIIGPFAGASIEVHGGGGKVNNLLMPALLNGQDYLAGFYQPVDFSDYHYGGAFNYRYRDLFAIRVSYDGAPQDYDKGNAAWLDRAKHVVEAKVTVNPVKALDLELGYRLRSGRSAYEISPSGLGVAQFSENLYTRRVKLGDINNLHLGAAYQITPAFTVGVRVENLLNEKWDTFYGIPSKGVSGLAGIGYKF